MNNDDTRHEELMIPRVHLNGTSRQELCRQYSEAAKAVSDAIRVICENGPNARDYYVKGDGAFRVAVRQHEVRIQKLREVFGELFTIMGECETE